MVDLCRGVMMDMIRSKYILLLLTAGLLLAMTNSQGQSIYRKDNLVAWCIVPFDNVHRTPQQRIAMLKRLRLQHYAYDWRVDHLATAAEEWKLARDNKIDLQAVWIWIDGNTDSPGKLGDVNERLMQLLKDNQIEAQLWVGFNANFFANMSDEDRIEKGVLMLRYLKDRADELKCSVALYNHGDWFGNPENQVRVIKASGIQNVGIVYNFHHAHDQLDRYEQIIAAALPYLWTVNLDGMRAEGPKILTLGEGNREKEMMLFLKKAGYKGRIGILGHVETADVEKILQGNLQGMARLLKEMKDSDALKTYRSR